MSFGGGVRREYARYAFSASTQRFCSNALSAAFRASASCEACADAERAGKRRRRERAMV